MKLTDKRFWKFEAIVLVCTSICIFILWINHLLWFNFIAFVFCCLFLVGGAMTWKLYKGSQWWKLGGFLFLNTTVLLAIVLFGIGMIMANVLQIYLLTKGTTLPITSWSEL